MQYKRYFSVIIFVVLFSTGTAAAIEPIPITLSGDMDKVKFDGRWTFLQEWKESSLNTLSYDDGTLIQLRTAHQNNFIYVLVDAVSQIHFSKGSDTAMVCFDKNNNKNTMPDADDYCFVAILEGKNSFVLEGNSSFGINGNFKKIPNPEGFIGIGGISDENDRYSNVSHTSYEFRIPTDLVGRSDSYGFYLTVYDAHNNKFYSWPQYLDPTNVIDIPSPSLWGSIISPDQSLPEFQLPILTLVPAFFLVLYVTKFRNKI